MLAKRIIPCLDVRAGKVVKGVQFKNHEIVGDILALAEFYVQAGADELVFYDITASTENRSVDCAWIKDIARCIDIPFCVAGGIRSVQNAEAILHAGADKISLNSPALENPSLINACVSVFGQQCVVIGIDSILVEGTYKVCQYTGDEKKSLRTERLTEDYIQEVQERGAGEIVLNCMNQDGMREGYDLLQLKKMRAITAIPLIASGGAGTMEDFSAVFTEAKVDGALAASVFHRNVINIMALKNFLAGKQIRVRL